MNLKPLSKKYGSDKCTWHSYGRVYDQLFYEKPVHKMLEIGIGYKGLFEKDSYENGASLKMWAEYFPDAEIYGLDIKEEALVNEGRIHSYQCDQGSILSLLAAREKIGRGFDLIVDDGSHFAEHQVLSAHVLWPCVGFNGRYVIEDVWDASLVTPFLPFSFDVMELRTHRVKDDRLIVSWVPPIKIS